MNFKFSTTVLAFLSAVLASATTPSYTITDLGTLGYSSDGYGLNNLGVAVGQSNVSAYVADAFSWTSTGGMINLGKLSGSSGAAQAYAINDSNLAVGWCYNSSGDQRPCFWSGGGITEIMVGAGNAYAYAVNNLGHMLGRDPNGHPFFYSGGTITDLYMAGMSSGDMAYAINDSDEIAGSGPNGPCILKGGVEYSIGNLGRTNGRAKGINYSGQVVGISTLTNWMSRAFIWTPKSACGTSGTMVNLGVLGSGDASIACGLNDWGDVVGQSNTTAGGNYVAYVAMRDGTSYQLYDLNSCVPGLTGWTLGVANSINDSGCIVGIGRYGGYDHAFLLTPI